MQDYQNASKRIIFYIQEKKKKSTNHYIIITHSGDAGKEEDKEKT